MNVSIKNIINKHPEFCFFILAVGVIIFQLFILWHEVVIKFDNDTKIITYGFRSLADAIIILLPYWLLPAKYRHCIWLIITLFSIWTVSQLWYYRTYNDLMPFSSFMLFSNISPLLIESIKSSIHAIDWSILLSIVLLLISDYILFMKKNGTHIKMNVRIGYITILILIVALVHIANGTIYYFKRQGKINNIWERYIDYNGYAYYFNMNGFAALGVYSMVDAILENQKITQQEISQIENYLHYYANIYTDNSYTVPKGYNLILIIIESLNSWVIDFKVNKQEITPFMNKLCHQDGVISALKIQPQVKDGRSSDAHFMYNTGILPLKKGVVATRYGNTGYPSLAKALKGYKAIEFICDDAKFWNQKVTACSYGFSRIYDRNEICHETNDAAKDRDMFQFASNILAKEKQPFYAQLVTISMHQPYDKLSVPGTVISQSTQYSTNIKNYLEAVHYCDSELEKFIENLKKDGLYNHSVIVIVSDHNEMDKNIPEGREEVFPEDKNIAMIILNTPHTMKYQEQLGQIDIYPTLLDVMGANHYAWKGVGQSIFRKKEGKQASLDILWDISSLSITKRYFNNINFDESVTYK